MFEMDSVLCICILLLEGVLVVVILVGYDLDSLIFMEWCKRFVSGIEEVLKYYGDVVGNVFRDFINGVGVDGCDGIILLLWDSDKLMI